MQWMRDEAVKHRVRIKVRFGAPWNQTQEYIRDAKKWCSKNKIMVWNDTNYTMRFTSEKDLVWFLLRWS